MRLFYDDEFQALREVIEGGKGYKETAMHLWPGMKPESAYAKLKACTNEHGDQRLKFREYIAVQNFNGRYDVTHFMEDECFLTRSLPKSPVDEEAKLVNVIESAGTQLERALKALENVKRREQMRAA